VSDVGRGRQTPSAAGKGASPDATSASTPARAGNQQPGATGRGSGLTADGATTEPSPEGASATSSSEGHASPLDELGGYIRHQRESAALSLRKLAKIAGVSNPYLSQIERGLRKPSAEILQAIAKALEISSETLYVKAGILDEREIVVDVEVAVAADPHLSGPQRQALLEMYRSFRRLSELKEPRPSRRRQLLDALTVGDVDDDAIRAAESPAAADEA
jgi:transcriptional regulator with XRE-family HTH domain